MDDASHAIKREIGRLLQEGYTREEAHAELGFSGPRPKAAAAVASTGGSWARLHRNRNLVAEIETRLEGLATGEIVARRAARDAANRELLRRLEVRQSGRPQNSAARPGRTDKKLKDNLTWAAYPPTSNRPAVTIDLKRANSQVKHWVIHELGTGKSGMQRVGQPGTGKAGRPRNDRPGEKRISIPSQVGRVLKFGLGFGVSPDGGKYFEPSSKRIGADAVHRMSELNPDLEDQRPMRIKIRTEIVGRQMVRHSAVKGFALYERKVLASANGAFQGADHRASGG